MVLALLGVVRMKVGAGKETVDKKRRIKKEINPTLFPFPGRTRN